MLFPAAEARDCKSFKQTGGMGFIQLKCEKDLTSTDASMHFCFSIGNSKGFQASRGPVHHDFSANTVCSLPGGQAEWDFSAAVDRECMTFTVSLQAVSHAASGCDGPQGTPRLVCPLEAWPEATHGIAPHGRLDRRRPHRTRRQGLS